MKRILIGGLHHESNSFSPIIAGPKDFSVLYGDEILAQLRENDALSGIITTLQAEGYELIPTVFARAVPNGEVDPAFFNQLKAEMLRVAQQEAGKLDAVCLALHGSMRVHGLGEAEGLILEELRAIFPDIPIFVALDMHATFSQKMHDHADGFVGYKQAPHTDCTETGILAAKMTHFALTHSNMPKSAWVRIPMLIAGEKSGTAVEPMKSLIELLRHTEKQPGVLAASYLLGFPWADNVDASVSVYVVCEESQEQADRLAVELAEQFWQRRSDFVFVTESYPPALALAKALEYQQTERPIYISDSGDNPTAGASADHTDFLKIVLQHPEVQALDQSLIYAGFYDPVATKACAGKFGESMELQFGAGFDHSASEPITAVGIVKAYVENYDYRGMFQGDLALFSTQNVDIVLAEQHIGFTDPQTLRELGLSPEAHPIIVCKLGYLTPGHAALAKRSILALTAGNTQQELTQIEYQLVPRPIYPLEPGLEFSPIKALMKRSDEQ